MCSPNIYNNTSVVHMKDLTDFRMKWLFNGRMKHSVTSYLETNKKWRKSKCILKAPLAAAIRQLTLNHSLDLAVGFTRKTVEPREKHSKHGRDQLQQLYSHEFQVLRINTRIIPMVTHPAITPGGHPSSYNPRWSPIQLQPQMVTHPAITPGGHPSCYNPRWSPIQL